MSSVRYILADPNALYSLERFSISDAWFSKFGIPNDFTEVKTVLLEGILYILSSNLEDDQGDIVFINNSGPNSVFGDSVKNKVYVLDRIITVARSKFTKTVSIPASWKQYHEGSKVSVYASPKGKGGSDRLHFNFRPNGCNDLYAFCVTSSPMEFDRLEYNETPYLRARSMLADAILSEAGNLPSPGMEGIVLSERLPQGFVQGATLAQWYEKKLTKEQRDFVDMPHDSPVRLRGNAGTGKTLALVVKFLRDAEISRDSEEQVKYAFVTHSEASSDLVTAIAQSLDSRALLSQNSKQRLEIRTLYDIANEHLHFKLDQLEPLSLDGREGRLLQLELIRSCFRAMASSPADRSRFDGISQHIKEPWLGDDNESFDILCNQLMNEFASVLEASGIRAGEEAGENYVKNFAGKYRPAWLMDLPLELDRRFVLAVHKRYRRELVQMNTIGVDQMIADFNGFLESNRSDILRERDGYDALYVDELHLFNSIERQTLHKMLKRREDDEGRPQRPAIFMAYDLKQSPRDTFTEIGSQDNSIFTPKSGLQNSQLIELSRVFRYTPQIAEFLKDLDASFPGVDIPGDWQAYSGDAKLDNGDRPKLINFQDEKRAFRTAFQTASRFARNIDGGGRRIAVLCPNFELFDRYLDPASGQFEGKFVAVQSRQESLQLKHAGKRFVFSMPEYVAGLQFDTVVLLHVDQEDSFLKGDLGARRRFISSVYLGASRAEKRLLIFCCESRGGPSDILSFASDRGSLLQVDPVQM